MQPLHRAVKKTAACKSELTECCFSEYTAKLCATDLDPDLDFDFDRQTGFQGLQYWTSEAHVLSNRTRELLWLESRKIPIAIEKINLVCCLV